MAAVSIRDLDDGVKRRLQLRAAAHKRSMEAEIRAILVAAVADENPSANLGTAIMERFAAVGGVDLDIPPRTEMPRTPDFPQ